MNRTRLLIRLLAESIFGVLVLLTVPLSLLNAIGSQGSKAYMAGSFLGISIMLAIGVFLIVDAVRVGKRIKAIRRS